MILVSIEVVKGLLPKYKNLLASSDSSVSPSDPFQSQTLSNEIADTLQEPRVQVIEVTLLHDRTFRILIFKLSPVNLDPAMESNNAAIPIKSVLYIPACHTLS
jgi:hypothetical protein